MKGFLARSDFPLLLQALQVEGYTCYAPRPRQGALVFAPLEDTGQLPQGIQDEQQPGSYRLKQTDSPFWFDWANSASAIKPHTFAPQESLWTVTRNETGQLQFQPATPAAEKKALLGVRACDLAALAIQDQHFLKDEYVDPYYQQRRDNLFLIGVNCTRAADTCFCQSTGDGPVITQGYDWVLSEIEEGFILETGSEPGEQLCASLPLTTVSSRQQQRAHERMQGATQQQRSLPTRPPLYDLLKHQHWQDVGERCLACGNCTSVCPTCFCHQETEHPALDGAGSEHTREWSSCFDPAHSYIHGGAVRRNHAQYYRQWLTHKLAGWYEQFGRSGCTGCGRCISWCPAEIDLTAEVAALTAGEGES